MSRHKRGEVFSSTTCPVTFNSISDVTIVEFLSAARMQAEAAASDPRTRLVHKEWPIVARESAFAAFAAFVPVGRVRHEAFHNTLMSLDGVVTEASTIEIAETVELDVDQLPISMEVLEIQAELERNHSNSAELRSAGTPILILDEEIIPGQIDIATSRQHITRAREPSPATGG